MPSAPASHKRVSGIPGAVQMLEDNEERDHDGFGGLTPAEVLANAKVSTLEWPT